MTDKTIPADKVRAARDLHREEAKLDTITDAEREIHRRVADAMEALLPPPPRPTLAGMTWAERAACQWMQADVENLRVRYVIANPVDNDGTSALIGPDGGISWRFPEYVTPRPDLPRLTWPGDEKPAPAPTLPDGWRLADHPDHGRGVVTTPTPNSDGRVCFAIPSGSPLGYNWHLCAPYELTYIDQEADTPDTVPESTLAVGSEWRNADALTRACEETGRDQIVVLDRVGDAHIWSGAVERWEVIGPLSVNGPFTILHDGKKADQ